MAGMAGYGNQAFYDHGIRDARDFEAISACILENPVRAGLVKEWENYSIIGGALIAPS